MVRLMMRLLLLLCLMAFPASATGLRMAELRPETARLLQDIVKVANDAFPNLPSVALTSNISAICGGDAATSREMRYCVTQNTIFVDWALADRRDAAQAAYMMGHMFGHAIQVRHGVADRALAAIRAEPAREGDLRAMVTSQVECLAGVLVARAGGQRGSPLDWFETAPFTGSHWGAAPLSRGPQVRIGLALRDKWFRVGAASQDVADCAVGEMGADLLVRAER